MLTGPDVSHFQGAVDFAAVKAAGHSFAVVKATEGTGYTDPLFAINRNRAAGAGLHVGMYHFARAGDPHAEAAYFLQQVGTLKPGEFVVLDWEVPHPNPPLWCAAWMKHVGGSLKVKPLLYMNQTARDGWDWTALVPASLLWLAKYDNSPAPSPAGAWRSLTMKQFTDRGACPGISGGVDLNAFYGDATALANLGTGGAPDMDISELYAARDAQGRNFLDFQNFVTGALGSFDQRVSAIDAEVKALGGGGGNVAPASAPIDYDAIAQKVADLLAQRLQS